jgi:chaperonin cofactor prefoldin
MKTLIDSTLSAELQELYLENKEWLSNILFLEDEMQFLNRLFKRILEGKIQRECLPQIEKNTAVLNIILQRRKQLKIVLMKRKRHIEKLLDGTTVTISLSLIDEDAEIIREIKSLMLAEKILRDELFALVQRQSLLKQEIKNSSPLKKAHRYPIY